MRCRTLHSLQEFPKPYPSDHETQPLQGDTGTWAVQCCADEDEHNQNAE